MKRGILIFLLLLPLVSAQTITVGNQQFSIILLIPLIFILIGILFFLLLYIKDHFSYIKKIFKLRIKKKEKKPIINYKLELDKFIKRSDKLTTEEAFKQFLGIVKDYFADRFHLDYQYTFDELEEKLQKIKPSLIPFAKEIAHIKYSGKEISKEELDESINKFSLILKEIKKIKVKPSKIEKLKIKLIKLKPRINILDYIKKEYISSKINFLRNILKPITFPEIKIPQIKIETKEKEIPEIDKLRYNKFINYKVNKINKLIEQGNKVLEKNIGKANINYIKALKLYYELPIENEQIASDLINLYNNIEQALNEEEDRRLTELTKKIERIKALQLEIEKVSFLDKIESTLHKLNKTRKEFFHNTKEDIESLLSSIKLPEIEIPRLKLPKIELPKPRIHKKEIKKLKPRIEVFHKVKIREEDYLSKIKQAEKLIQKEAKQYKIKLKPAKKFKRLHFLDNLHSFIDDLDKKLHKIHLKPTITHPKKKIPHGLLKKYKIPELKPLPEKITLPKPLKLKKIKVKPVKIKPLKTPLLTEKIKSPIIKKLNKEEKDIIKKLNKVELKRFEKIKKEVLKPIKITAKKPTKIKKIGVKEYKAPITTSKEIKLLTKQEQELFKKLTKL